MHWIWLSLAIAAELLATTALQQSAGFTRLWPTLLSLCGYAVAFFCLSLTLKQLPVGVVYALWSGLGVVGISLIGWLFLGQTLDRPALIGLGLIVSGVVVLQGFSSSVHP